jgi:tetratricopeptide (TPR) repeat protein
MESILDEAESTLELRARVRVRIGFLLALQGRELEALDAEAEAKAILHDLGVEFHLASFGLTASSLQQALGRLDEAETLLRSSAEIYKRSGEKSVRSTVLAVLAQVLIEQGRVDEAEHTASLAIELGSSDDVATIAHAQGVLGRVLGQRGNPDAQTVARQAVELIERTDMLWAQGQEWEHLAEVLSVDRRDADATTALRQAVERFDRKQATALAARVRARLR